MKSLGACGDKMVSKANFPALKHMELTSAFHMYVGIQSAEGWVQKWRIEYIADKVFKPLQQLSPPVILVWFPGTNTNKELPC